jgi:hypothetical protein
MEAIARRTMRQANGYAWMYENMAFSAKRWSDLLNIASGVLGGIVGTSGVVSIVTDSSAPLWARIVQVVLGFLVSVVAALTATWRLSETQMDDVLTQVSYATLAKDLMWQLAQPRKDRQDAREYVRTKLGEIEQLKVSAPTIDTRTRHAYNSKFKNNPIFTPEDQWDAIIADVPFEGGGGPDTPSDSSELSAVGSELSAVTEPVTPDDSDQSSSLEDDLAQADAGPAASRAEALNPVQLMGVLFAAYDAAQSRQNATVGIEGVDGSAPAAPPRHKKKSKNKAPDGTGDD